LFDCNVSIYIATMYIAKAAKIISVIIMLLVR